MGILDDAIKEHLDLKRRHGARESELREIEEDAFGSGEGPDPFAAGELFQETPAPGGSEPGAGPPTPPGGAGGDEPTRLIEPRGSAEAPPAEAPPAVPPSAEPPSPAPEPAMPPIPGEEPATPPPPSGEPATPPPPGGAPEPPPFEPETPAPREPGAPGPPAGIDEPPETSESPADQPALESQSLAELMAEEDVEPDPGAPDPSASGAVPEAPPTPAPSEEGLAPTDAPREPETSEPELPLEPEPEDPADAGAAPETPDFPADAGEVPDPPPPPPPGSEPPGRARGRVHHPTEEFASQDRAPEPESEEVAPPSSGPLEPEGTRVADDEAAPAPGEPGGPALFDFETEDEPLAAPPADEFEDLGPVSDEPYPEDEPYAEAPPAEAPPAAPDQDEGYAEPGTEESFVDPGTEEDYVVPEEAPAEPSTEEGALPEPAGDEGEDLLADSPEFADEGGEDEEQDLWFEKGPPQDFDFEDEDR